MSWLHNMTWRLKNFQLNPLSEQSQYDSHDLSKQKLQTSNQTTCTMTSNCAMSAAHMQLCWGCTPWNWAVWWTDTCQSLPCAMAGTITSGDIWRHWPLSQKGICWLLLFYISSRAQHARWQLPKKTQKKKSAACTWDTEYGEKSNLRTGTASCQHHKGKWGSGCTQKAQ